MITNPGIPEHRFPILLARSDEGYLDAAGRAIPDGHPADICLAEYVEAESIDRDAVLVLRPLAPSPADDRDPTWMPDGRIAFISDRDGEDRLYATRPGQSRPDLLVDANGVRSACFAPDGREMAYLVEGPEGCALWRAEPDSTQAARVAIEGACHIAYAPDGKTLLVQRQGPPEVLGLYALDLAGGDVTRLVKGDAHHGTFSPDGRTLAFIRADAEAESLCLRNLATGDERVLVEAVPEGVLDMSFTPDGSRILVHAGMERHEGTLAWFESATYVAPTAGGDLRQIRHADALSSDPKPERRAA